MIYFIQATDGGPIKIGWSINVAGRLRSLQSAINKSGRTLRVLGVIDGEYEEEHSAHDVFRKTRLSPDQFKEHFKGCRISEAGASEWFADDLNLIEYIETFSRPLSRQPRDIRKEDRHHGNSLLGRKGEGWGRYSAP